MGDDTESRTWCDWCGSVVTRCWDEPDAWVIKCFACGLIERIWKDNEYQEERDDG